MNNSSSGTVNKAAKRRLTRKVTMRLAAVATLICTASIAVYAYLAATPDITQLIPSNTVAVGSVDSTWLWTNTSAIRAAPPVAAAISQVESESGVSIESDIAPWLGQVVVASLSSDSKQPKIIAFAQIKDMPSFVAAITKIKDTAGKSGLQSTDSTIDGRSVTQISKPGDPDQVVSITLNNQWLVAAYGDGTLTQLFDTWDNKTPSLATNKAFANVIRRLTASKPILWGVGDVQALTASASETAKAQKTPPPIELASLGDYSNEVSGAALVDKGNTLDFLTAGYCRGAKIIALNRSLVGHVKPITGTSLKTVPNSASAAFVITCPSVWIRLVAQEMHAFMPKEAGAYSMAINQALTQVQAILTPVTGEMVVSGIFTGKDGGINLTAATTTPATARAMAINIAQTISRMGAQVGRANNVWTLPAMSSPQSPFNPGMRTYHNYVEISTNTKWLSAPSGQSALTIPTDAVGSYGLVLVSFKELGALFKLMPATPAQPEAGAAIGVLENNNIQNASLASWTYIDPTGIETSGTTRLSNLDWKATINGLVSTWKPTPPPAPAPKVQ